MNSDIKEILKQKIFESITESYFLVFTVNLKNGTIEVFSDNSNYSLFSETIGTNINDFFENNPNIEEAYYERVTSTFNLEALQHAFKNNKKKIDLFCEYKLNEGYRFVAIEVYFVTQDKDSSYAIFTFKDIDSFVVRHQKSNSIFNSLTKIYSEIFYLNLETGKMDKVLASDESIASLETSVDYEISAILFCNTLVHINDRMEFNKRICNFKKIKSYYKSKKTESLEFRKIKPNTQNYRWYRVSIIPIDIISTEPAPPGVMIVYEDISSLKKETEQKALESLLLTNAISLAYSSIIAVNISKDTYYTLKEMVNEGDKFTGHNKYSKVIKTLSENVTPDYRDEFLQLQQIKNLKKEFKKGTRSIYYEFQANLSDNQIHWISLQLVLMQDPYTNDITCISMSHIIDETREQEARAKKVLSDALHKAEEASKAKTEFLSRMSHDIRTPMNGIIGFLEIIKRKRNDKNIIDDSLNKIDIASHHLLSLINDVLNMSKLDSDKINLVNEPFNIYNLLKACCVIIEGQISDDTSLELITDIADFAHPNILGSVLQVQQVLINILGNSIKYNKPGGKIYFTVHETKCTNDTVHFDFIIRDTGIGMSKEFVEHIFEPFTREDTSINTNYSGSGLGMSIVQKLVELMNGTIEIETEKDVGSTFKVTIPFKIDHSATIKEETEINKLADLKGCNVLLVEDNLLNQQITEFILKEMNAKVEIAENGKIAVEKFCNNPSKTYSIILMDLMMPVMGGLEATKLIRNSDKPDAKTIPIIAMTANTFSEDIQNCLDCGMNTHIGKPIEIKHVSNVLRHYCK